MINDNEIKRCLKSGSRETNAAIGKRLHERKKSHVPVAFQGLAISTEDGPLVAPETELTSPPTDVIPYTTMSRQKNTNVKSRLLNPTKASLSRKRAIMDS